MCSLNKILVVSQYMNPSVISSIGTKHPHTKDTTVLLGGRIEFNPVRHRRDSFDVLLELNLWVRFLESTDLYEAGVHGEAASAVSLDPLEAITEAAYNTIVRKASL